MSLDLENHLKIDDEVAEEEEATDSCLENELNEMAGIAVKTPEYKPSSSREARYQKYCQLKSNIDRNEANTSFMAKMITIDENKKNKPCKVNGKKRGRPPGSGKNKN